MNVMNEVGSEIRLSFVKDGLVFAQLDVSDSTDAISTLADQLFKQGFVTESYKQAVLDREEIFPTGLPSGEGGVAIPHTDVKYVNKPVIAFATLKKPVFFKNMADKSKDVKVRFVAMLAMKEPHSQVQLLQKLMEMFQEQELMSKLVEYKDSKELYDALASYFN